jgi:hypothetical protein
MTPLNAALLAGGAAAFAGALAGVLALSGALSLEPRTPAATPLSHEGRRSLGAFLLASHAVAAAALWQVPTVGACMAASLGAGWIAASTASFLTMLTRNDHLVRRSVTVAARAALGVALLSPLWAYVQVMRLHIMGTLSA